MGLDFQHWSVDDAVLRYSRPFRLSSAAAAAAALRKSSRLSWQFTTSVNGLKTKQEINGIVVNYDSYYRFSCHPMNECVAWRASRFVTQKHFEKIKPRQQQKEPSLHKVYSWLMLRYLAGQTTSLRASSRRYTATLRGAASDFSEIVSWTLELNLNDSQSYECRDSSKTISYHTYISFFRLITNGLFEFPPTSWTSHSSKPAWQHQ